MATHYQEYLRLTGGHTSGVSAVAFNSDGSLLATAGLDGNVCIWDASSGNLLHIYSGGSPALSLCWKPGTGKSLQCGTECGNIVNLSFTESLMFVDVLWAHNYPVECLDVRAHFVASGAQAEVSVWEWESRAQWTRKSDIRHPTQNPSNVSQSLIATTVQWITLAGNIYLFVTYMNHGAHIFETDHWSCIRTINTEHRIARANVSPDSLFIAMSDITDGFRVYDFSSGKLAKLFQHDVGSRNPVPVLFFDQGRTIIGGSTVGRVNVWKVESEDLLTELIIPKKGKVLAIATHSYEDRHITLIATAVLGGQHQFCCILWKSAENGHCETAGAPRIFRRVTTNLPDGVKDIISEVEHLRLEVSSDDALHSNAENQMQGYSNWFWMLLSTLVFAISLILFSSQTPGEVDGKLS